MFARFLGFSLKCAVALQDDLRFDFGSSQVEMRGNKLVCVKPKMYLTASVSIPADTWVKLP